MQQQLGWRMIELIRIDRSNHARFIDHLREMRKEFTDPLPGLTSFLVIEQRSQHFGNPFDESESFSLEVLLRACLSVIFGQRRFILKEVNLRR